jgi:hypothetical protein
MRKRKMRMMLGALTIATAITAGLPASAAAQDRAVTFSVRGGGFNGLTDLADGGAADFKTVGYSVGGGLGVELTRYVALRGDFTFARNELRLDGADSGDELNRYFYELAVQLQYPTEMGLTPYVFAGGGGITVSEAGASGDSDTNGAGTFGLGVGYTIPQTGFGLFIEGRSWLFGADGLNSLMEPYDRNQYELAWTGGFSYRLPF